MNPKSQVYPVRLRPLRWAALALIALLAAIVLRPYVSHWRAIVAIGAAGGKYSSDWFDREYRASFRGAPVGDAELAALRRHLEALSELNELNLCGTRVTDEGLKHLAGLADLRRLDLSDTAVTGYGLRQLDGLRKLKWLSLDGSQVRDADLAHLRHLRFVTFVDLDPGQIRGVGVAHLNAAAGLEQVGLVGATDETLADLAADLRRLTRVKTLLLWGEGVSDRGWREAQRGLTNLVVGRDGLWICPVEDQPQ